MRINKVAILTFAFFNLIIAADSNAWEYIWRNRGDAHDARFGDRIVGVGDQNQDGFDDILVFSDTFEDEKWEMFYGGNPMDTIPDWIIHTEYNGSINVGDINGDGIPEMGIPIYISHENYWATNLYLGGDRDTIPDMTFDVIGGLNAAGDINGDGLNDLIIGWQGWMLEENFTGFFQIYLNSEQGMDTIPDFEITGNWDNALLGSSISSGYDINGDGFSDFSYTSRLEEEPGVAMFHIHYGREVLNEEPDIEIRNGIEFGEFVLEGMKMIEDFNGDNIDEFIIGLPEGRIGILFGREQFELNVDIILNPGPAGVTYYTQPFLFIPFS